VWVRDGGHAVGHPVRVRILARDVSLALTPHGGTSIQNILPGVIDAIADDGHPALALVRLRVGESSVLARLTKRSADTLGLAPGRLAYAQIKAVALIG
jgi:molybdate transport system ATP-binding protein